MTDKRELILAVLIVLVVGYVVFFVGKGHVQRTAVVVYYKQESIPHEHTRVWLYLTMDDNAVHVYSGHHDFELGKAYTIKSYQASHWIHPKILNITKLEAS